MTNIETQLHRLGLILLIAGFFWLASIQPKEKPFGALATQSKCIKLLGSDGSETDISIIKGRIIYSQPGSTTPDCL